MSNQSDKNTPSVVDVSVPSLLLTTYPPQEHLVPPKSSSDEVFDKIYVILYVIIGLVSFFGIMSNIVNIVVYVKQNVKESTTTISFTCLAVTDLGICLSTFAAFTCQFINYDNPKHYIDVNSIRRLCIYSRIAFAEMSMFTTVFLSVERCLCVTKPLTFKKIITKTRTVVILALFHIKVIVFYGLLFYNTLFVWKYDDRYNMTRYTTITTEEYDEIHDIHIYINGYFFPVVLVALVTTSTIVMIIGLRRASRFRNSASSCSTEDKINKSVSVSPKEAKLAMIVVYLLLIFIITYSYIFGLDIVSHLIAEIEYNMRRMLWPTNHIMSVINASVNAIVYFNMSSRYRKIFMTTFCNCIKTERGEISNGSATKSC